MQDLIYGETTLGQEMNRALEALSEERGCSQLDLAGEIAVLGYENLEPLEWARMMELDAPTHRVFGDNPNGSSSETKVLVPWNVPADVWDKYLDWCSNNPVNVKSIVDATFKSSLAVATEGQGEDFVKGLDLQNYSHLAMMIDRDFHYWNMLGGNNGGCLDRDPNW